MAHRLLLVLVLVPALAAWSDAGPDWPHAGPTPDEAVSVSPSRYAPIAAGTKTFRPIEPMPWGDVNKRVAPPEPTSPAPPAKPEQPNMH